jgi:hypothetical protein
VKILILALVAVFLSHSVLADDSKEDQEDAMATCLKAWGKHPFGNKPQFKTMATSVKVFGIGHNPQDLEVTKEPALIMVNPAVNVMGGTVYELLNPNGWYCFKANVNVMGGLVIKTCTQSHIASAVNSTTVMGSNSAEQGVTVMGGTKVETVSCK